MNDFSIHARAAVPEQSAQSTFLGKIGAGVGKMLRGGQPVRTVVHLVGATGAEEVFSKVIGEGQIAANERQFQEMLQNHQFVPIPMRQIRSREEAGQLKPKEVVFVKMADIAKQGIAIYTLKRHVETVETPPDLKLLQVSIAVSQSFEAKLFFDRIRNTLIDKWSQPVAADTLERARDLVEYPKMQLNEQQRTRLAAARTGGSATIQSDPKKYQDWQNAEQFIREKAVRGEDLTVEDLCTLNQKLNGDDNEEIGGGELRDHAMLRGGVGGLHYVNKDDVRPLMEDLVKSIKEGIQRGDNPVVLAASAYQKMVSIHPFADGNGRTCRLVMDYVLMRAGLPPPSLQGEEVNVAIFGDQKAVHNMPAVETPTTAVEKVMAGIQRSYEALQT